MSSGDINLGVPIGQTVQGASSFADDLALIATDREMAEVYLEILERWCKQNHFAVNVKKSGILRVGRTKHNAAPSVYLHGKRIPLLNEPDPDLEPSDQRIRNFKYLGVQIPPDGTWDQFLDTRRSRCRQALGRFWKFFRSANVSVKLKLRVAHTLILSHFSYGDEIVCLSEKQAKQLDTMQATVLRTILQLPKTVNHDAILMLYITGERSLSSTMRTRRVTNLQRIKHLPRDTQLRKLYEQRAWHSKPFTFSYYDQEEKGMRHSLRLTSASEEEFTNAITSPLTRSTKQLLKKINTDVEKAQRSHVLRLRHGELLEALNYTQAQPMLERSSLNVASYARWLVGATKVIGDQRRDIPQDKRCRLCQAVEFETRKHLITDCKATESMRLEFKEILQRISHKKLREFYNVPKERQ